jgi:hypothetical protein
LGEFDIDSRPRFVRAVAPRIIIIKEDNIKMDLEEIGHEGVDWILVFHCKELL